MGLVIVLQLALGLALALSIGLVLFFWLTLALGIGLLLNLALVLNLIIGLFLVLSGCLLVDYFYLQVKNMKRGKKNKYQHWFKSGSRSATGSQSGIRSKHWSGSGDEFWGWGWSAVGPGHWVFPFLNKRLSILGFL